MSFFQSLHDAIDDCIETKPHCLILFDIKMSFFSDFQSKFTAKHSGQYIEAIIKSIANDRIEYGDTTPAIVMPFFRRLKIKPKKILRVESEQTFAGSSQSRRADLVIEFQANDRLKDTEKSPSKFLYIEIKVDDKILDAKYDSESDQLDDYLKLVNEQDGHYFVLFTANPIKPGDKKKIEECGDKAGHLYISEFCKILEIKDDALIEKMFLKFLIEKGYSMFEPTADEKDDFLSFMALNFLIHSHGHGRVVSERKISNGPVVFSKFIKNWQLIGNRMNELLNTKVAPAVRYLPEQITTNQYGNSEIEGDSLIRHAREMREKRIGGRMWLISEVVVDNPIRLSWSLIYSIENKKYIEGSDYPIKCQHVVALRNGNNLISEHRGKVMTFDEHLKMPPESVISELQILIRHLEKDTNKNFHLEV